MCSFDCPLLGDFIEHDFIDICEDITFELQNIRQFHRQYLISRSDSNARQLVWSFRRLELLIVTKQQAIKFNSELYVTPEERRKYVFRYADLIISNFRQILDKLPTIVADHKL